MDTTAVALGAPVAIAPVREATEASEYNVVASDATAPAFRAITGHFRLTTRRGCLWSYCS